MKKINHTGIRNEKLFCYHCGGEFKIEIPMPVGDFVRKMTAFNALHKDCKKTWKQLRANQSLSLPDRVKFWQENGERGRSSELMFCQISGYRAYDAYDRNMNNHPHDPDDFRRCYELLIDIPEWRDDLYKMSHISNVWKKLVDNWDKLTKMFENKDEKMYDFMKEMGC
uniref:Uncharacterized protein n=1 Tax=viral metagenome TaxID=1070528 RepID=A0A6M3J6D3_9ZZZZ